MAVSIASALSATFLWPRSPLPWFGRRIKSAGVPPRNRNPRLPPPVCRYDFLIGQNPKDGKLEQYARYLSGDPESLLPKFLAVREYNKTPHSFNASLDRLHGMAWHGMA